MTEQEYAKTAIKEECEKCGGDTTTLVKRVYIPTSIEDEGYETTVEMPHLKYKQTCSACGDEVIYYLP